MRLVQGPQTHTEGTPLTAPGQDSRRCTVTAWHGISLYESDTFSHTCCSTHTHTHTGPDRSIIKQSYDARERLQDPSLPNHLGFGNLNGDGFGIGWYAPDDLREGDPTPCMYKSITPAW